MLRFNDEEPIKRWFGVSSSGSVNVIANGCQRSPIQNGFNFIEKGIKAVFGESSTFFMAFKECFTDLIRDSQILSILGLTGGLKIHVISF